MKPSLKNKTIAFIRSIRPETTPIGMISVYVGGLVAGATLNSVELLLAVLSTFFITSASMTINDFFDWKIDTVNHPKRPIPMGILTQNEMLYFSIIFFVIGTLISLFINTICFAIAIFAISFLLFYEVVSKKYGVMGNITVAFISSISFTFGGAAVGNPFASISISAIAFLIILGREIIMDIRDAKGDSLARITLPNQIGARKSSYIACLILLLAAIFSPLPFIFNIVNYLYLIIIIPVDIITLIAIFWSLKDIQNAAKSATILRFALIIGLVAFISGIDWSLFAVA